MRRRLSSARLEPRLLDGRDDVVEHQLLRDVDARRRDAAPVPARPARGRPGRRRGAAPPSLATRSIKTTAKAWAIDTAISMVDLTTLEGADTPGKVRSLCAKAMRPDPADPARRPSPRCACTPTWSRPRSTRCAARPVADRVSVATAFPSGRAALDDQAARRPRRRRRRARPRSTWSSTAARSSPGATCRCSTRSSRPRRRAATRTSRSSSRPASSSRSTTCAARRGWRCSPAATSSRPRPARSTPAATPPVALVMLEAVRDFARAAPATSAASSSPAASARPRRPCATW